MSPYQVLRVHRTCLHYDCVRAARGRDRRTRTHRPPRRAVKQGLWLPARTLEELQVRGGDGSLPAARNPDRTSLFRVEHGKRAAGEVTDGPPTSQFTQTTSRQTRFSSAARQPRTSSGGLQERLWTLVRASRGSSAPAVEKISKLSSGKRIERSLTEPRAAAELCSITLYGHGPASTMAAHCLSV